MPDLYEYFDQPDHERDLKRASRLLSMPKFQREIHRGATARQQRYYAMVDRKIEELRSDTYVATRVREYLALAGENRDTYIQQLVTDIADARLALEGTILALQEAVDQGVSVGIEEEHIDEALRHLALLRAVRDQIEEHRQHPHSPKQGHRRR